MTNKPDALPVVAWLEIDEAFSSEELGEWEITGNTEEVDRLQAVGDPNNTVTHELCLRAAALEAIALRDAELSELRAISDAASNALHAKCQEVVALQAELAAMRLQKPVAHQFQARDGEWYVFQSQKHYEDTAADGSWPIRALYAAPVSAPSQVAADVVQVPRDLADELLAELSPKNPVSKALRALLSTSQGEA